MSHIHKYILLFKLLCRFYVYVFCLAFRQRATGPSSVCEGNDVTLQCLIVLIIADNTIVQSSLWTRAPHETLATTLPNHRVVRNANTGALSDLVITNVTLEDDNTVYTCANGNGAITSSVVLNVTGNNMRIHM